MPTSCTSAWTTSPTTRSSARSAGARWNGSAGEQPTLCAGSLRRPTTGLWKNLVVPDQDELALTERLISYDTSHPEGIRAAVGFVKGWLEARGIAHREYEVNGLPALVAAVGDGPATLVWNSHVDVVPARREQFSPWRVDGKLYGRGAYDMKGALGAMLAGLADLARTPELIPNLKVKLLIVPDEEAEEDSAPGQGVGLPGRGGPPRGSS